MKKYIVFLFAAGLLAADSQRLVFPKVERLKEYQVSGAGIFTIAERMETGINEGIFSLQYTQDGRKLLISTTDFNIYLFDLVTKKVVWQVPNKMKYNAEHDGPAIYDISSDDKYFLTSWQLLPEKQGSERGLLVRSLSDGKIVKKFKTENSTFYSRSANIDFRIPSAAERKERDEAGLGKNWVYTIDSAKFIEKDSQIIASYMHNMTGPHLYDRSIKIYDAKSAKKLREFQLVCDPESANWDQPAGFEIGHFRLPYVYSSRRKSVFYGTSHGRIHEMNFAAMAANAKTELVEEKNAGKILFNPIADSSELEVKNFQSIRALTLINGDQILLTSAGAENYTIQIYGYELKTNLELLRTSIFEAGRLELMKDKILVVGPLAGGNLVIANLKTGKLLFHGASIMGFSGHNFAVSPQKLEVVSVESGTELAFLRPASNEEK